MLERESRMMGIFIITQVLKLHLANETLYSNKLTQERKMGWYSLVSHSEKAMLMTEISNSRLWRRFIFRSLIL